MDDITLFCLVQGNAVAQAFPLRVKVTFLNEKGNVEYLGKDYIYKATLREDCLCTKDGKYCLFIEFIRVARGLKPNEIPTFYDFHSLIINGMTYWEVCDKIYKFISYKNEDNLFIDHLSILWSDDFEKCLRQLYTKEDIVAYFGAEVSKMMIQLGQKKKDNELGQSFRKIHYNLVGISTSYKQTQGEFTEVPCHYTICSPERYFAPWENVKLGSSIEIIESQGTAGTLSAVVSDKHLEWIDLDDLKQSFGRIASEDEAYREISEKMCHVIDGHRQNSALARYEREIPPYSNNVSEGIFEDTVNPRNE
ncbi:hypothetical protein GLOIN_2v1779513 [Rhizophagus irregularis DAOM 181602=DAOM 197198]|uniref:Uncharacterized protein n=1 Tax=Rhizophagus irregularis (strain DAOM 181602 / DAOM 197198 / MUCL 43194) TaxID=747089 RepID=A0A2P4PPR5_RHIID|nr:hypothetical protein GLOIN_2v1779513 [Rhizophagus irregularis DAOM 181602=DAOM 197198]POG67373.1 hypothetical protein GLOIN_2v1779513 [Rhizophagus irregularis DAOM 181602=DAOM 197198]|eukprot:XP_025174239.1 hypothetical protein GLOIN_2v1779513 [Rhizophagus irregularis DAOM 181602=DAOM 197198]